MNKLFYITLTFVLVALFSACDPIVDMQGVGTVITSADQIEATLTPIMDGSKKTNKVKVHCTSPVLCHWAGGPTTYISNDTTVLLFGKGDQTIKLTVLAADGTQFTKSYTVTVDEMFYPVPKEWGLLAGAAGSKTWVWATDVTSSYFPGSNGGKCYGNGGYMGNNSPGWWTCGLSDLTPWGVAGDEMTFDINGAANFTLVTGNTQKSNGKDKGLQAGTHKGIFSFDMSKTTVASGTTSATAGSPWAIGQLTLVGTTISLGYQPNGAGFPAIYIYDILYLDDNVMVLEKPEPNQGAWGTAWFWVFKRKGFTF